MSESPFDLQVAYPKIKPAPGFGKRSTTCPEPVQRAKERDNRYPGTLLSIPPTSDRFDPDGPTLLESARMTTGSSPDSRQTALRQEIAALEHELRRVNDGLERNRTRELEARAGQLRDNIELCRRELEAVLTALHSRADED